MLYSALLLGLISSLHCVGMCGPIALMLPVARNNPEKKFFQITAYHIGRLSAYSSIGLLFGILGRTFYLAGAQQYISIFAGVAMIAFVAIPERTFAKYNFSKPIFHLISKLKSSLAQQFKNPSISSLYLIGLMNGFLPCGLVYAAVFGSLAMHDVVGGIAFMALFGLGTVPLMSGVVYFQQFVTLPVRNRIQKIIPYAIVVIGLLFIIRGLSLNIPYLSPSDTSLFVKAVPDCH